MSHLLAWPTCLVLENVTKKIQNRPFFGIHSQLFILLTYYRKILLLAVCFKRLLDGTMYRICWLKYILNRGMLMTQTLTLAFFVFM